MVPETEPTAKRAELPMRLTRLRVKNFRSIADIDIPLSPLTVLVGPNGSGKSNVVDALRFVRDVFARGLDQAVMDREGMGVIQRWGTEGEGITIGINFFSEVVESKEMILPRGNYLMHGKAAVSIEYIFSFNENTKKTFTIKSEQLSIKIHEKYAPIVQIIRENSSVKVRFGKEKWINIFEKGKHWWAPLGESHLSLPEALFGYSYDFFKEQTGSISDTDNYNFREEVEQEIETVAELLSSSFFYSLNPIDLRQPQQMLKETPFNEKGRNLAAVLRHLSTNIGPKWEALQFALQQAIIGFDTVKIEAVGGYLATKLIYRTGDNNPRTSYLGQESDGTIRMLGLLAALQQEPSQPFISIEEPEANIHPGALAVLAGVIDEASLRSQILVTTHSPDMLDHLPVESFLVVEKVGDTTHVGPLDASQVASVRKRLFTPSELFRMEGLQRQAAPEAAS
ncbi:AAA family ATPase [Hymenobacter sp. PAMC 26628]|uniref:AAA family ATPase n=1 Tax=Hymenobacter sp. PAMC 26628 TaxID=1484118 RepID=UPI000902024C|nr:AAA family ATPase [Hymenobacter sp. PAMC 26628]